ncbi:imidazole glycerol phosphate synthase subunit HisH [Elizabethkingia argentiflava]|uniref:Imidazole glycerol phosphate synthase subunit HisH n=1 Tax=Elizabethkingia argenteiflava TaxID=2681556 RepID=A0A845PWQ0_9FLAO|nr:imidazole glycerol phosphate synthase subunit HisH [Elizabethkingia argenteiflava]NAW50867.1 imidazole glycerol phosphate synthase subunit HisH [Elizabethkingia argenteiflava]
MISIVKYNTGNVQSVYNAVTRLGYQAIMTDDPELLQKSDKVILPGVGEASSTMQYLQSINLDTVLKRLTQPVLGICLGQQLLCKSSEEGNSPCLGIFDVKVKKFPPRDLIPHVGWNSISDLKGDLFKKVRNKVDVYYVHSYYCEISDDTTAITDYILPFSATLQRDNFYATQFHPEKSADIGVQILNNFLKL